MNQRASDPYPPRPRGYRGLHRAGVDRAPGFSASGVISDRLRTDPELKALDQNPSSRGESKGRYDK